VYLDGVPAGSFPIYGTSANNFTGRLVLANSPVANNSWSGQIRGLAIYGRQLTPAQIVEHYESWTRNQRPALAEEEVPVALYAFHEHGGDRAHNQWNSATDLVIPPRYFVLHPGFLKSPWREYQPGWDYWEDVGVNVAGFIPLGFCVVAYLAAVRGNKRPATAAILVGLATSLTIELLQALLPTRESGMTDLMTNTLGTAIGVGLYRWPFTQRMLSGAGLGAQAAESSSEPSSGSPAEPAREFARVPADSAKLETSVSL
jgi:hypothetical protein